MVDSKILAARFYTPQLAPSSIILDKIAVRDYVLDCRIGVFQDEKTGTQRVRFTVEMSLFPSPRSAGDNLQDTVSYDTIVEAIRTVTGRGHINLLETLAERIADECLADRRAAKVRVLVEKLDRLKDASLSVEIERHQRAPFDANVYALPWAYAQIGDKPPGKDNR